MKVGEVLRIKQYATEPNRWRVYLIVAVKLGGTNQEGTYELRCCDWLENEKIEVPCIILETHSGIQVYRVDKWISLPLVLEREQQ